MGIKGVVSKIVPVEEMPFLDDGQPVDIVLKPPWCSVEDEHRANIRNSFRLGLGHFR